METAITEPTILNGRYEILRFLDKGQFGSVYYGINRYSKTPVAIKIDKQHGILCHEATVMDFLFRGGCLAIPHVCWFGLLNNTENENGNKPKPTCLVMDYFPHSLQDYFPVGSADKNALMRQMITICRNMHNLGIIHRDIKPKNFMWSTEEHRWIRLIDFGLATVFNVSDINTPVDSSTAGGQTGNLRFMSPFVKKGETPSKRDDLISVGYIYKYISTPENTGGDDEKRLAQFMDSCFSLSGSQKPDYDKLRRFFV